MADVATPENDRDLAALAQECTVRELHEVARTERGAPRSRAETDYEARSVRFNDNFHTVTAQLPAESYAEVKSDLETRARALPSDGETRWDQRLCDVFLGVFERTTTPSRAGARMSSSCTLPLATVADESSEVAGELERGRTDQRRDGPSAGLRRHRDRCPRRRPRPHDVRGPGPAVPEPHPTSRGHAKGSTLPVPGLYERDVHERASHQTVGVRRSDRFGKFGFDVPAPSLPAAQFGLVHDGERQRGAHLGRADRTRHDVAPVAALDDRLAVLNYWPPARRRFLSHWARLK